MADPAAASSEIEYQKGYISNDAGHGKYSVYFTKVSILAPLRNSATYFSTSV
jgi:hypothetical protein